MDNLKLPAYPTSVLNKSFAGDSTSEDVGGFTKLELAALIITANMVGPDEYNLAENDRTGEIARKTAKTGVYIAKAVLQEANK